MKDMKRCNKQVRLLVLGLLALAILMTGCGSKKEADSEQQAIQKVDDLAGKKIGVWELRETSMPQITKRKAVP